MTATETKLHTYCPVCGCGLVQLELNAARGDGYRVCHSCGQEWWEGTRMCRFYWLCSGCDAVFEDKRDMVPRNSPGFRCPRCGMLCKRQHIANAGIERPMKPLEGR